STGTRCGGVPRCLRSHGHSSPWSRSWESSMPSRRERRMHEEPEYVVGHVEAALAADPRVNELGVHVVIRSGRLYLNGTVLTEARRAAVAEVAAELGPEYEIHNEI